MRKDGDFVFHNDFESLEDGEYNVKIDTELIDGELNYGELILPGKSKKKFFGHIYLSSSMANNELSGPSVVTYLSKWLMELKKTNFTYRIIFIPETIDQLHT